jgi:hypothetical protein
MNLSPGESAAPAAHRSRTSGFLLQLVLTPLISAGLSSTRLTSLHALS